MATVTGFTSDRMLEIEESTIVDGEVVGNNLILTTRGGTPIDAGNVRGATGAQGPIGVTHVIQDEGLPTTQRPTLNFVGTGIAVSDDATNNRSIITVNTLPGHVVQDETVSLTQRSKLNFAGSGVTVVDDAANDRSVVTIPAPGMVSDLSIDTAETGEIGLTWLNLWGYGFPAVGGQWYEINWWGNFIGRIASSAALGGSTRLMMTTPSLGTFQMTVEDTFLPAPSVPMPFHVWTIWRAPVTENAQVEIQAAQAWWSATTVRLTRTPAMPQRFLIKRLGSIPTPPSRSLTVVGLTKDVNKDPNL